MLYKKDNQIYDTRKGIEHDGFITYNASEEQMVSWGYQPYEPEPFVPTVDMLKQVRIDDLKFRLSESDYKALKWAEGWFTEEQYAPIKAERQAIRDEINNIENMTDEEYLEAYPNEVEVVEDVEEDMSEPYDMDV